MTTLIGHLMSTSYTSNFETQSTQPLDMPHTYLRLLLVSTPYGNKERNGQLMMKARKLETVFEWRRIKNG